LIKGAKLRVFISGNEARLFGTPSDFNAVSRAIRKCKVGTSIRLPLERSQSQYTSLEIRCTTGFAAFGAKECTLFIAYPEKLRRRFSPLFAMPAETQSGSIFFISASQIDALQFVAEESLEMILQVVEPDHG